MEKGEEKEVEEKDDGKELGPDPFTIALNEEDFDPDELEKEEEKKEEVKEEKKEALPSEKEKSLEMEVAKLRSDKSNLQKALHEERQSKKAAKETEGTVLTDAELSKIIEEHKDDPAVLLNAVTYKMNTLLKKGKAEAVSEVEVKQKQGDLDKLLRERYGDALDDETSIVCVQGNKAKEYLGLQDHPYGDALGIAAAVFVNLPQLMKEQYDRGVKDQLEGKAEKKRVASIEGGKVTGSGKKSDTMMTKVGLTEGQKETAKLLGFHKDAKKMQIYRNQILKIVNA